jgi:hypothetical protein
MIPTADDDSLRQLANELRRVRHRARRYQNAMQSDPSKWQHWSAAVEDGLRLVARICSRPAASPIDLSAKFDAIFWQLMIENSILDTVSARQLRSFGRELRRMATDAPPAQSHKSRRRRSDG